MKTKMLAFFLLTITICLFGTACSSSVVAEGTWYSVTDARMYNFADGNITVSGVTVGQYEDNGDYVVVSLIDSSKNLKLYITTMGNIDVMADVKSGDGNIYFCKGMENAQAIIDAMVNQNPIAGEYFLGSEYTTSERFSSIITVHFKEDDTVHIVDSGLCLPGDKRKSYFGTYFYNGNTLVLEIGGIEYTGVVTSDGKSILFGSNQFNLTTLEGLDENTRKVFE